MQKLVQRGIFETAAVYVAIFVTQGSFGPLISHGDKKRTLLSLLAFFMSSVKSG